MSVLLGDAFVSFDVASCVTVDFVGDLSRLISLLRNDERRGGSAVRGEEE